MNPGLIPRHLAATKTIRPLGGGVIPRQRLEAQAEAESLIARAQERARQIEEQAKGEFRKARDEGLRQGRREAEQEMADRLAKAARLADIAAERHLPGLIELASQMASQLVRSELELRPQAISHICREVIRENRPGRKLKLLLHPGDLERLREEGSPLIEDGDVHIDLEAAPDLQPGGCVVRSELGQVDARLNVQLKELCRAVREASHV